MRLASAPMSAPEFAPSVSKKLSGSMPVAKFPMPTTPMKTTTRKATRAAIQRTNMGGTLLRCARGSAVGNADGSAEARDQLGLHAVGIDGDSDLGRGPVAVLGPIQAAGQVRIRAGVAGQRLGDLLGHEIRAQQRGDQHDRVVQVGAVDAIGPTVESNVKTDGIAHDAGEVRLR